MSSIAPRYFEPALAHHDAASPHYIRRIEMIMIIAIIKLMKLDETRATFSATSRSLTVVRVEDSAKRHPAVQRCHSKRP
jgi:hypothetical protein